MSFAQLGLNKPLLEALARVGYTEPTPIQQQAIGPVLSGRDMLGCAQTGTGKTAAFALPILQRLAAGNRRPTERHMRVLVLTPTRELCAQVAESFRDYGRFQDTSTVQVFGGVSEGPQKEALRRGVDVCVATPGRLLDLMDQGFARLAQVEVLILDEADRMLDMGFINDIRKVVAQVPRKRQTLLFSATLPKEIRDLARGLLSDPVEVSVAPQSTTAENVSQEVYFVPGVHKQALLEHLLDARDVTRALVFTRTKHRADRVARALAKARVTAEAIHGNKSQNARLRALDNFKRGKTRVLVASDIAARGLDIDEVSHVINYDVPNEPETYVHRIGRTARAGNSGKAMSFCDQSERGYLRDITRLINLRIPVIEDHPFHGAPEPEPSSMPKQHGGRRGGGRGPARPPQQPHARQGGGGGQGGGFRGPPDRGPAPDRRDSRGPDPWSDRGGGDRRPAGGGGGGGGGGAPRPQQNAPQHPAYGADQRRGTWRARGSRHGPSR